MTLELTLTPEELAALEEFQDHAIYLEGQGCRPGIFGLTMWGLLRRETDEVGSTFLLTMLGVQAKNALEGK